MPPAGTGAWGMRGLIGYFGVASYYGFAFNNIYSEAEKGLLGKFFGAQPFLMCQYEEVLDEPIYLVPEALTQVTWTKILTAFSAVIATSARSFLLSLSIIHPVPPIVIN
jgi:hypothetical protein